IGEGQTISQPYVLALMLEKLQLTGDETVLEVGTGSGYTTALLAQLTKKVYSTERIKPLYQNAKQALEQFPLKNIKLAFYDGSIGWEKFAPFDVIFVGAAASDFPDKLTKQLKIGGRMVVPVGTIAQKLLLVQRTKKGFTKINCGAVRFVPIIEGTYDGS
nr:protein-L-isoaspartate O-methyltransferase [bacterium]